MANIDTSKLVNLGNLQYYDQKIKNYTEEKIKGTNLSDLVDDAEHRTVTDTEKASWNAKSDFSGSYEDLSDIPSDLATTGNVASALSEAKTYTDNELAKFDFIKVVDSLPETGLENKIYLVPIAASSGFPAGEPGAYTADGTFSNLVYTWDDLVGRTTDPYVELKLGDYVDISTTDHDIIVSNNLEGTDICPYDCNGNNIVLPENTTYIDNYQQSAIGILYIKATTPPDLKSTFNVGIDSIVVPRGCGDVYKSAPNWSNYENIIVEVESTSTDTEDQNLFDEWIWVNKGTEDAPEYVWEWITTKQIEVDLTEYATIEYVDNNKTQIVTTEGTGSAYTATVPGITELTPGVSFVMIPHVVSTSTTPTLNVNSLGAIELRRLYSQSTTSYAGGYTQAWLKINIPTTVMYDGKYWIAKDLVKPNAYDLYGNVPVYHGGTGKATHTANSILTGNEGNEVNNVPTKSGALFATGDGVAATFDTLPIAQGGTGATTEADVVTNLKSPLIDLIFPVGSFFVTSADSGLDPNNLFGGYWIGCQYNRTYTVTGTQVFTIASNPFPVFMLSDILTMFQNTYGPAVIPSVEQYNMSISIGNGDGIANAGGVSYVWRNDVLCVQHSMSNGAARFNYAFSIVQPEPIIHWYRVT